MKELTGAAIFEALIQESWFVNTQPPVTHEGWSFLCQRYVVAVTQMLQEPVTVQTCFDLQVKLAELSLDQEFMLKWMEYYSPQQGIFFVSVEDAVEITRDLLINFMEKAMIVKARRHLQRNSDLQLLEGVSEEEFFIQAANFSQTTLERWRTGELTVGELLLIQPGSIFKHD